MIFKVIQIVNYLVIINCSFIALPLLVVSFLTDKRLTER